jgi:hypothetical protein
VTPVKYAPHFTGQARTIVAIPWTTLSKESRRPFGGREAGITRYNEARSGASVWIPFAGLILA